jgi:energy-converting hydrogenase Eha subunit B
MRGRVMFGAVSGLIVVLPVLIVVLDRRGMAPFWFLAGDAFLYLGIAQASVAGATGLAFSFDGIAPTNGFHPLWQVWLRLLEAVLPGPLAVMQATLASATMLALAGTWALGAAIARLTGSWGLALLAAPGAYFLTVGQGLTNLAVWSFLDGMEAALVFALAGWLSLRIAAWPGAAEARAGTHLAIGAILALIVLARLDEALLVAGVAGVVALWPGAPWRRRLTGAVLIALPGAMAVAAWIGWSLATTGLPLPVSGAAKGEGGLLGNIWVTAATLFPPMQDLRAALTDYTPERDVLFGATFRVVQLLVPAAFAVLWAWVFWRWFRAAPWAVLMVGLAAGVILKAGYNFVNVNLWHQAYWYFAVAMMAFSLAAALMLAPVWEALMARSRAAAPLLALALGGFGLVQAGLWGARLLVEPRHAVQAQFWSERDATRAALTAAVPDLRVIEFGDGAINHALHPVPVRHGFIFAGDAGSLEALRKGRLLAHALDEGFGVLSSYEYLHVPPGAEDWGDAEIRAFLEGSFLDRRVRAELDGFSFRMVHVWRPTAGAPGVPFIGLERR